MADSSVYVDGVASGAFKEAFAGLPPWATEEAALKIEKAIKDQTKVLSRLAAGTNGPGGKPVDTDELNKALQDSAKNMRKNLDERKGQQKEEKKWFEFWKDADGKQKQSWSLLNSALITAGLAIKQTFVANKSTYDELTASGLNLVAGFDSARTGFESLQQLSDRTGVRFTELSKTMQKFSGSINAFGVGKFANTLKDSSKQLTSFGFSTKESAELLGSYLESQRGYTDTRNKSEKEVSDGLVKFGKRVNGLSMATGMATSTLLANIEAISQSTEAMILNGQMGTEAADKTLAFVASFRDQNVGRAFLRMMTDAISPLNDTFQSFQKIGFGGFGNELMSFTKSLEGLEPEEQAKKMAQFAEQNGMQLDAMMRQANLLRQTGLKAEADDVLAKISGIQQQARLYREVSDAEREKLKKSNEASKQLSNAFEKFMAQLQITFAPTANILNILTAGLESLNTVFDTMRKGAQWLEEKLGGIMGFTTKTGKVNADGTEEVKSEKVDLINWVGLGLAVYATIKGFGLLSSAISGLYTKITRGSAGGAGDMLGDSGKSGGGKGRAGGRRGGSVDNKAPGFISKLANSLAEFGNPKVLLGVAALAGLAGTLYVTGAALKQFTEISWESVAKAGVAIGGLLLTAKALGQAGPQMAIGAASLLLLSGALYVTASGLEKFAAISWEDMGKAGVTLLALGVAAAAAGAVAPAIILGSVAFGAMGLALGVVGTAAAIAAPGLTSLSASLLTFQMINGQNLINVATGIGALSVALVAFSAANAAGSVGSIFSGLAGGLSKLFGGGGGPVEQIQKLASLGEGLNKTVTSLQSLSGAIASLSQGLGSITGIDKIGAIVSSVNDLNLLKAAAFSIITPTASSAPAKSKVVGGETLDRPKVAASGGTAPASIDGSVAAPDINSTISAQRQLIEQLVKGTNELISVNKDILKYTKLKQ